MVCLEDEEKQAKLPRTVVPVLLADEVPVVPPEETDAWEAMEIQERLELLDQEEREALLEFPERMDTLDHADSRDLQEQREPLDRLDSVVPLVSADRLASLARLEPLVPLDSVVLLAIEVLEE